MMLQLNPAIPVLTPMGAADAVGWIDYGNDYDLQWICLLHESRICVTFRQQYIRMQDNITMGRQEISQDKLFRAQKQTGRLKVFEALARFLGSTR